MTTKTRPVTLTDLALAASTVSGERDLETAISRLIGEVAVFHTFEGEERIGLIEAPITGPASSGGYPIIRFANGMWGRCDEVIHLVEEGGEDLDAVDRLLDAHAADCTAGEGDPEDCGLTCHILWTRRALANV
jgi:hypothetical protein